MVAGYVADRYAVSVIGSRAESSWDLRAKTRDQSQLAARKAEDRSATRSRSQATASCGRFARAEKGRSESGEAEVDRARRRKWLAKIHAIFLSAIVVGDHASDESFVICSPMLRVASD